jgi:hypothetical protein
MVVCNGLAEAAKYIDGLHSSFGYCIYPIDTKIVKNITVHGGMLGTRKRGGYRITGPVTYSHNV